MSRRIEMDFVINSANIELISEALSKAQGVMESAIKDSSNPFFKSKFSDLTSVISVAKKPLADNGLSITSSVIQAGGINFLVCTLCHNSGQWMRSYMPLITAKGDMQGLAASITYSRRYSMMALCNIACEDDDGNVASGNVDRSTGEVKPTSKEILPVVKETLTTLQKDKISAFVDAIDDEDYLEKLCKFLNVKTILEISAKDYEKVIGSLEKKVGG